MIETSGLPPSNGGPESERSGVGALVDGAVFAIDNLKRLTLIPLAAGLIALGLTFLMTPIYSATTTLMTPQRQESAVMALAGSLAGLAGGLGGIKSPGDQWIGLLKSRSIADALIDRFNLLKRYDVKYRFEARDVLDRVSDMQLGKDGLITISVLDKDPQIAQQIAAAYVEELEKLSNRIAVTEAGQRRLFFEQQVAQARKNLDAASARLQEGGVGQGVVKTDPATAVEMVARLKAQITAGEVKASVMRGYMTDRSADLQRVNAEIQSLRQQLASVDRSDNDSSDTQGSGEYVARYRDFKYYETLFQLMAKQYELAKIDEAQDGTIIQVVDPALVPEWKAKPKRAIIAISVFFVTFLLLLGWLGMQRAFTRLAEQDASAAAKLQRLGRAVRIWRRRTS